MSKPPTLLDAFTMSDDAFAAALREFYASQVSRKAICYDAASRKFQMFLDGEPVGLALTYSDADRSLDELIASIAEHAA